MVTSSLSGPAREAGIRPGDIIVSIDGRPAAAIGFERAVQLMVGEEGTLVHLTVLRPGSGGSISFTVVRRPVSLETVKARVMRTAGRRIGYLRLLSFSEHADERLERATQRLVDEGAEALILDLRGNPGGLLAQAIRVSSLYLESGEVGSTAGANQEERKLVVGGAPLEPDPPMVTSSTTTRRAQPRSWRRRFGTITALSSSACARTAKTTVQSLFPLSNGAALRLTTASYLTPAGKSLAGRGLKPKVRALDDIRTRPDEAVVAGGAGARRPAGGVRAASCRRTRRSRRASRSSASWPGAAGCSSGSRTSIRERRRARPRVRIGGGGRRPGRRLARTSRPPSQGRPPAGSVRGDRAGSRGPPLPPGHEPARWDRGRGSRGREAARGPGRRRAGEGRPAGAADVHHRSRRRQGLRRRDQHRPGGDGLRVWVHIADVAHYVPAGCALDRDAAERTLSVYVPGLVEPMLPERISNSLCSLVPYKERHCVTVEVPFGADLVPGEPTFYRSVIRSDARLTYSHVEAILTGRERVGSELEDDLRLAERLSQELRRRRFRRGALRIETGEVSFGFDDRGQVERAWIEAEPLAHALVEELMILANEAVARLLAERRREALYRVHEPPGPAGGRAAPCEADGARGSRASRAGSSERRGGGAPRGARKRARRHVREAVGTWEGGVSGPRPQVAEAGEVRLAQPRSLGPREPRLLPLHLADPPLPGHRLPPGPAAGARPLRRPSPRGPRRDGGLGLRARAGGSAGRARGRCDLHRLVPGAAPVRARLGRRPRRRGDRRDRLRPVRALRRSLRGLPARGAAASRATTTSSTSSGRPSSGGEADAVSASATASPCGSSGVDRVQGKVELSPP